MQLCIKSRVWEILGLWYQQLRGADPCTPCAVGNIWRSVDVYVDRVAFGSPRAAFDESREGASVRADDPGERDLGKYMCCKVYLTF
jgi:hypothetical protein